MTRFAPGFQLSVLDVIVLIAGAWGTWFMGREVWWAGVMVGFVVGHFFLFCNVFRISRGAELIWAAMVVILGGATVAAGFPGWPMTFAALLLLTVMLVAAEMRRPSYHGVLWQRVNPNLRTWWESEVNAQAPTDLISRKDQDSSPEEPPNPRASIEP